MRQQYLNEAIKRQAEETARKRIAHSGLTQLLGKCIFATYKTPEQWQRDAKKKAQAYVDDHHQKWFLAAGSVGSGKTHLCTAICGALLDKGKFVRYMLWRDDSVKLKAAVNDSDYATIINPIKRCQFLYIDDLFKGGATEADKRLAFEILNYRYVGGLSTIISTELTPEELLVIDEATGSRIYERSKESCVVVTGRRNWRINA
jgi:DNA replication protein DnaC